MKRKIIGLNVDCLEKKDDPAYLILSHYVDAVYEAGGMPLLVPAIPDKELLKNYVDKCDAFVFTGGRDYPPESYGEPRHAKTKVLAENRYSTDFMLLRLLLRTRKTILGICAGHQLLNITLGGKLIQHIEGHSRDVYHKVKMTGQSGLLNDILGKAEITVNSTHHQVIDPAHLGRGLYVSAVAEDGVIEAVEGTGRQKMLGLQWHPERIRYPEHRKKIFKWLVWNC